MQYRPLGNSNLFVSTLGLGTALFGDSKIGVSNIDAEKILDSYFSIGGNFIDTSDLYGDEFGLSESIIGHWIKKNKFIRNKMIIASKCFFNCSSSRPKWGLSKRQIISSCDSSLQRLQVDCIDLYQAHYPDASTCLDETISAFDELIRQGKIRYYGYCNFPSWLITKSHYLARSNNWNKPISGQYCYNLIKREIEAEVVNASIDAEISLICWAPLAGGMLTGKYSNCSLPPQDSRFYLKNINPATYKQWVDQFAPLQKYIHELAVKYSTNQSVIALSWLMSRPKVASCLVGVKSVIQLLDLSPAFELMMIPDELNELEKISQPKHPYPHLSYFPYFHP